MPSTPTLTRALSRNPWATYAFAVALVGLAALLRLGLAPLLHSRAPYAVFYFPVILATWFCGLGPGLFALALSVAAARVWFAPVADPNATFSLVVFSSISVVLIALTRAARHARDLTEEQLQAARRAQRASGGAVWDWNVDAMPFPAGDLSRLLQLDEAIELSTGRASGGLELPESDRAAAAATVAAALTDNRPFALELRGRLPDGEVRWLACRGEAIVDVQGRAIRLSGITLDITERKRAEEIRAYFAAIVESSDDAIIGKNLNGVIQSCNAAAERLFGYSSAELIGKSVTILIPEERLSEETEILTRIRRGERIEHFETVRRTRDGRFIELSLTVSPVRAPSGEIVGVSKIARDITERKRAAEALAAQREWFRVTLASIGDAVIASDPGGHVTFMNATAERLTGWSMDEAVGRPLSEVFHIINEQTREPAPSPAEAVIRTGRVVGLANYTLLVSRDGIEWPIDDSAAPILDDAGRMLGVVLVFHDVAIQRRLEQERHGAGLERERLLESERSARAEAERANRVKDDFVAMVSHELRTPLNAILGWTQLLLSNTPDPDTLRHGLEVVSRNTRVQAELISDLLDISRIVSGKLRLDLQPVDLAEVVADSVETVQQSARSKEVELVAPQDVAPVPTVGDPARLQQVVWNLLSNAIKFTPGGGRVSVELRRDGDQAEIVVTDTGIGVRAEALPHLFERFRQSGAATTRRHGGLGLGLSIVRHLVELHGGSVRVHSEGVNHGSTFVVTLPILAPTDSTRPQARDAAETAARADGVSLEGIRVLVVEDDPDTRDMVQRILEAHRATVFTVASAPEALERLAQTRPDVLVSDIGLPDVDGYELMRQIRRSADDRGLPAIALTAFARSDDRTRALRAGYQAHVTKPVEPAELVMTVASLAGWVSTRRPTPA